MSITTNFVVNFEGRSELIKVTPEISYQLFWKTIMNMYQFSDNTEMFLYAVPNDFSYPIFLTEHIYSTFIKATSKVGVNNVIHLRVLTPLSFIFEVNPTHFSQGHPQGGLESAQRKKSITRPAFQPITEGVEGFYFDHHKEANLSESMEGDNDYLDPRTFIREYIKPNGIDAEISLNPGLSTFELKDNTQNMNYAARIQIKNQGTKKLIAMNWSLRQILAHKGVIRVYPLPDLEAGQTYDLIFNLNLKPQAREVTHWCLCVMDNEGEERFFGDVLKAELKEQHPEVTIIQESKVAEYVSGICPI